MAPDAGPGPGETQEMLLTGWGRTAPTRASVWRPARGQDLCDLVARPPARGLVARGLGRSYGDAAQNAGGTVALTAGLDRFVELDLAKGVVSAEAGLSLDALLRALVPLGWFPHVIPGTRFVTLGGAVASDIHGKYRHGSFCDYVTRLRIATPARGVLDVSPEIEPDIFWATAGGMGLTGVIAEVTLSMQPVETSRLVVDTERTRDIDDCMDRMLAGDDAYRYSVAWVDSTARGRSLGRSVLTRGNHARVTDLPARHRAAPLRFAPRNLFRMPPWIPADLLNPLTIRAFNELWFRRAPRAREGEVQTIAQFFTPLDGVLDWNRVYGRPGFIQHQFLVPYGAEHVVRRALERLSAAWRVSFLAVLKRFEHDSPGPIAFPGRGWALALDLPARYRGLAGLLDQIDRDVAAVGGRIYLTKDSRMNPELLPVMYPNLERWRDVRDRVDPHGAMTSDLGRRLGLVGDAPAARPR